MNFDDTAGSNLSKRLSLVALVCCVVSFFVAVTGLLGFLPGMSLLGSVFSGYVPMAPSTALSFVFLSVILIIYRYRPITGILHSGCVLMAGLVSLFGLLKFGEHFISAGSSFESLFIPALDKLGEIPVGIMSYMTGIGFFIAGIGVLNYVLKNRFEKESRWLGFSVGASGGIVTFFSVLMLFGYIYKQPFLYGQGSVVPMALTTSIAFLFLGIGIIAANGPGQLFTRFFAGDSTRARLLRVFIPLTILIILIKDAIDSLVEANAATLMTSTLLLFIGVTSMVVYWVAGVIGRRIDSAEDSVRESEKKFRGVFNQAAMGVARLAPDGTWLSVNKKLCDIVGYSHKELLSKTFQDITHPDDLQTDLAYVHQLLEDEIQTYSMEKRYLKKNGDLVWINLTVSLVRDTNNDPEYFISVIEDITERKQAETKLRKSEANLRDAQEIAKMGCWELDLASDRLNWSDSIFDIFEIDPKQFEASNESFIDAIHPDDRERVNRAYAQSLTDKTPYEITHRLLMKDGRIKWLNEICRTEFNSHGEAVRSIGVVQDITQRKLAEEKLTLSEKFLNNVIEQSPVSLWISDSEGTLIKRNQKNREFSGAQGNQVVGKYNILKDSLIKEQGFMSLVENVYIKGEIARFTIDYDVSKVEHLNAKEGSCRIVDVIVSPIKDSNGKVINALVQHKDITEQKNAEEKLRISEKRSSAYLENSPACTKILDLDFNLQFMSQAGILGLHIDSIEEYYGKPYPFSFYPDSFKVPMTRNLKKAKETGEIVTQEAPVVDVDGNELWFHSTIVPVKDDEDQLEYLMVVSIDTTERKQAEQALRESEENLSTILNSIGEAVIAADRQGKITQMNPVAENLTGWTLEDAKTRLLSEVFKTTNALSGETSPSPIEKVINGGGIIGLANHTILISRDGIERQIAESVAPITNPEGEIIGVVLVFRDVTEQFKLEEQVRQSEKMQVVGQLAGGIAHDFNNQLTAILGYSEILIGTLEDEQQIKDANHIKEGALRAANLTAQLLAFSHKGKVLSAPVSIHKIIAEVTDILKHSINKQIAIRQILNADPETTLGDPNQLQNALLNIAINARDAMPDGGDLIFETAVTELDENFLLDHPHEVLPGTYLMISITDNGCGMDAETRKHIFEPFFTTKGVGKGTGMGLASVYGTIRNHNGVIVVYSEVDHGTTFRIYLPLIKGTRSPELAESKNKLVTGTARILLVDDEEMIRKFAKHALEGLGYQTITCSDGKEAIEYFEKSWREIDLVLLDMIMPAIGGRETFALMKKINPKILAILSSGYSIDGEAQTILDDGVKAFIRKPYHLIDLSTKVAQVLQGDEIG